MRVASVYALDRLKGGACVVEETEQLGRAAVDKLCAEFDGRVAVIGMQGEDAAADAIAGFEDGDARPAEASSAAAESPATPAPTMSTSVIAAMRDEQQISPLRRSRLMRDGPD